MSVVSIFFQILVVLIILCIYKKTRLILNKSLTQKYRLVNGLSNKPIYFILAYPQTSANFYTKCQLCRILVKKLRFLIKYWGIVRYYIFVKFTKPIFH